MANVVVSTVTAIVSGVLATATSNIGAGATAASAETCTIIAEEGEALDLSRLLIRLRTSAGSALTTVSIGAGSYSDNSLGAYTVTVPSNGSAIYVGGADFESARFSNDLTTSQSVILTVLAGASTVNYEAVMLPGYVTG